MGKKGEIREEYRHSEVATTPDGEGGGDAWLGRVSGDCASVGGGKAIALA